MLVVITLLAMLTVEDADAEQAVNHTGNAQPSDASLDYWTGQIEQNTTWRDTVYVGGDVTIASGAILTLAPDTQVHFMPYHDDTQGGLDSTRAELIVEGQLHAQAEGIVFCSAAATSLGADWYGIVVKRGGLADVSNAAIRDGLRCLYAEMGGRVTTDHIAFANCGKPTSASQNSTGLRKVPVRERGGDTQLGQKLAVGVLGGVGGGLVGAAFAFGWVLPAIQSQREAEPGTDPSAANAIADAGTILLGFWGGNLVGTAIGVSAVDP